MYNEFQDVEVKQAYADVTAAMAAAGKYNLWAETQYKVYIVF